MKGLKGELICTLGLGHPVGILLLFLLILIFDFPSSLV
jgi:hypothetical protein